jgi:Zn finger protein HypA/HybF involved in hydrogenase expression
MSEIEMTTTNRGLCDVCAAAPATETDDHGGWIPAEYLCRPCMTERENVEPRERDDDDEPIGTCTACGGPADHLRGGQRCGIR